MALTPEQRQQILNSPNFQGLINKPEPVETTEPLGFVERVRQARTQTALPVAPTLPTQRKEEPGFFDKVKEEGSRIFGRVKEDIAERFETVEEKAQLKEEGKIGLASQIFNFASQATGAVGNAMFEAVVSLTPDELKEDLKEVGADIAKSDTGQSGIEAAKKVGAWWDRMKTEYPEATTNIESVVNVAEIVPVEKALSATVKGGKKIIKAGIETAESVAGATKKVAGETVEGAVKLGEKTVKDIGTGIKKLPTAILKEDTVDAVSQFAKELKAKKPLEVIKQKAKAKDITLEEKISPKFNIGEKSKAIKEGRVKTGADFPVLGKAPDIITPSKQIKEQAKTLRKYVDDVEKLDQFQIAEKVQKVNKEIVEEIRPQLKELPFTKIQKGELLSEWDFVKNSQKDSAFFNSPVVSKFQKNTETFLNQVKKKVRGDDGKFAEWTMSDLWDFRIAYDNLADVKRIKKLLNKQDLSGEEQLLIDMWKENRNIINQFVKDEAKNIGEDVGQKWLDMSDLYSILDNISSKGAIDLAGEQNIINKFITIPTKIIR